MIILSASQVGLSFGERTLFSSVSFDVQEGEKIGLVGVNGCGKTTLFKLITGEAKGDGQIQRTKSLVLGYVEQHVSNDDATTAYEQVLSVFAPLMALEADLLSVEADLRTAPETALAALTVKQHALQERFENEGGLTYRSRTRAALLGLGFDEAMFDRPVAKLSGGEKSKVLLARMLLSGANLLLLDEPTNHLDIAGVEWLENYLNAYPGAVIAISHDRYFLDKVTKRTFEIENKKFKAYQGNYSTYLEKKDRERDIDQHHYDTTTREIKRIEGIVAQQRQWNRERNIRTAESKLKQIARLERDLVKPEKGPDAIAFHFKARNPSGQDVLMAEGLAKSFGDRTLFRNVDLHIRAGERVFLLGANGCGKTTLLKILLGRLAPEKGSVFLGTGVQPGYYDQTLAALHPEKNVIDEVWDAHPALSQTEVRNALASFLFRADDVFKPLEALSGGERARVALLKLMLSECNFLLLDEPTNHLDIASREVLERALKDYDGTQLIVSHDRYFVNALADRVIYLSPTGATSFLGGYDDYVAALKASQAEQAPATRVESRTKNEYFAQKERQSEQRRLEGRIKRAEEAIATAEGRIAGLEAELCSEAVASDYQAALELGKEIEGLRQDSERLTEEWLALQEEYDLLF